MMTKRILLFSAIFLVEALLIGVMMAAFPDP